MTDVQTNEAAGAAPQGDWIEEIDIKGLGTVTVNMSTLDDRGYKLAMIEGVKLLLTTVKMGKLLPGITKLEGDAKEKAVAAVMAQAKANADALAKGTLVKGRGAAVKTSGAVQTEAMRLAKMLVKDHIKAKGQKIGAYTAKEITEYAKVVLNGNPRLIQQAEVNLAERAQAAESGGIKGLDIFALAGDKAKSDEVKAKPKVPPKPKAKKGEKETISAKQAGMVAPRQKPTGATAH
jgi:hypothetical protein